MVTWLTAYGPNLLVLGAISAVLLGLTWLLERATAAMRRQHYTTPENLRHHQRHELSRGTDLPYWWSPGEIERAQRGGPR